VTAFADLMRDPTVLIEGVLFRARYLGSTQLVCEGQPTKSTRMMQAEEAVSRIKVSARTLDLLLPGSECQVLFWLVGIYYKYIINTVDFRYSAD